MKFLKALVWASTIIAFLAGCSGKTETIGELPDIQVSGTVLGGALKNAEVVIVGIDANGQPQKVTTNGVEDYSGERLYTDANGEFTGYFNGAYVGPVLVVARSNPADGQDTLMTCLLQAGCLDSEGAAVSFGATYQVPDDFEIWGIDVAVKQGDKIQVSWLTHIAAKLAHSTFVSDGTNCTEQNCVGDIVSTGLITSQNAFKANDLVKNLFSLAASNPATKPYNPVTGSSTEESVVLAQEVDHGMLSILLEQIAKENTETLTLALKRIENEFLSHQGQFYQDRAGAASLSLKYFLTAALTEAQALQTAGASNSGIDQVVGELQTLLAGEFTVDAITSATGADYVENIAEQITEARTFVQNAQVWVGDIGNQQYNSFFDDEDHGDQVATKLTRFDGLWQNFKPELVENLQALYWLQLDFVEYAMTCVRGGLNANNCDASHSIHANASYDTTNARLTYVDGETELVAKVESISESADYFYQVTFTKDAVVETATGRTVSGLNSQNNLRGYTQVGLNKPLAVGEAPYIVAMGVYYPELLVRAKNQDGSCCDTGLKFSGDSIVFEAVGTKDVTDSNSPVHYNMLSLNVDGALKDSGDESVDVVMISNSDASSASLYYPEQKYPTLDIRIDTTSFQEFARLESNDLSDIDNGTNALAGWLIARTDIPDNDPIAAAVEYTSTTSTSDLESALAESLDLPDSVSSFEFGGFNYPGGETKVVIYRDPNSSEARNIAVQCVKSKGLWSCSPNAYVEYLGCNEGQTLGNQTAGLLEAFNYLRDQQCVPEVTIEGRGIYAIDYTNGTSEVVPFTEGQAYNISLSEKFRLEIDSSSFRLLTRFKDADGEQLPIANFSVLAQAILVPKFDETLNKTVSSPLITMSGSLTASYQGSTSQNTNGLDWLVPYGERNLWLAIGSGQNAGDQDEALAYYIQNGNVTLSMKAFDGLDGTNEDVGFVRYAGSLLGSIRKEGGVYVVRYVDNSWQIL